MSLSGRLETGETVQLGAVIARAGEGTIYEVLGHPEWVAKIFHPNLKDLGAKRAKVAAMITSQPSGATQSDGFVVLTWPLHTITLADGTDGYVMARIDTSNAVEIHTVSNPVDRMKPLPTAPQWTPHVTWMHLVNVASNLCLAVETVHHVNAVIGDFQERNILVNDTTRVTLVDVDSIQFIADNGQAFLCGVGRPEYTAPELARVDLATTPRQKPSDLFALAVHIHQLLMGGNHPFLRGDWTGGGDQPDAMTLAASGEWAGGPGSRLHTNPLAPPVSFLPPRIQQLFTRAFTDGARDPGLRPSAAEWRQALRDVQVTTCLQGHQIPVEADPCPWCAIDAERARRKAQRAQAPLPGSAQNIMRADAPAAAFGSTPGVMAPPGAPQYPPPYPPAPAPQSSANRMIIPIVIAALVVIGVLIAVIIGMSGGSDTESTARSTWTPTPTYDTYTSTAPATPTFTTPPPDARVCGGPVAGRFAHAAAGTDVTSCPFALNVRDAVNASNGRFPASVDVYSPVTNKHYDMRCAVERVLTCRGGNNAVVYVY